MTPLHETLGWLVDIPSVTGNEGRLCTAIAERLLPSWSIDTVTRLGNSLVVGRTGDRPLITLLGHIDTVPEQGNGASRVDGDRMYGLGTSDMKAGVAVMIHLLETQDVVDGPYDVVGVFYDKEEGSSDDNGLEDVLDRAPWLTGARAGRRARAHRPAARAGVQRGDERRCRVHRDGGPQRPTVDGGERHHQGGRLARPAPSDGAAKRSTSTGSSTARCSR